MLRPDDFLKSHLVTVGYQHGLPYGGHLAAVMVMSCLSNRVKAGWGTWQEVLASIPKFSATLIQPQGNLPSVWEPGFTKLLHEVDSIFDGSQDLSKGAKYWCDTRYIETPFFKDKILGNPDHPRVVEMNSLVFFK